MGRKQILIDPGHGGYNSPGATKDRPIEAFINLRVARKVAAKIIASDMDAVMTRQDDHHAPLSYRTTLEHQYRPALTISIHCNSVEFSDGKINPDPYGMEIFTTPGETRADLAAEKIVESWQKEFPQRKIRRDFSDGDSDKEANFWVLRKTIGPAVLIELDFVSNPYSLLWLLEDVNQERMANAITKGALEFVGEL